MSVKGACDKAWVEEMNSNCVDLKAQTITYLIAVAVGCFGVVFGRVTAVLCMT